MGEWGGGGEMSCFCWLKSIWGHFYLLFCEKWHFCDWYTHIDEEAVSLSGISRGSSSIFVQLYLNIYSFCVDLFLQIRQRFLKIKHSLSGYHTGWAQSPAVKPFHIFHLDMMHKLKGEFFCQFGDRCLALVIQAPATTIKKNFKFIKTTSCN